MDIIFGLIGSVVGGFGGMVIGAMTGGIMCKICGIDTNRNAGKVQVMSPGDYLIFGLALALGGFGTPLGFYLGYNLL